MKCHNTTHKGKKYFIPGCMGSAVGGKDFCTCVTPVSQMKITKNRLKEMIAENGSVNIINWIYELDK